MLLSYMVQTDLQMWMSIPSRNASSQFSNLSEYRRNPSNPNPKQHYLVQSNSKPAMQS